MPNVAEVDRTERTNFTSNLPRDLMKEWREYCDREHVRMNLVLENALRKFLAAEKAKKRGG